MTKKNWTKPTLVTLNASKTLGGRVDNTPEGTFNNTFEDGRPIDGSQ